MFDFTSDILDTQLAVLGFNGFILLFIRNLFLNLKIASWNIQMQSSHRLNIQDLMNPKLKN